MTEDGALFLPGQSTVPTPFRARSAYVGFRAFGSGDGAALLDPGVARALRSAAEAATAERRIAAGLLYGRRWADDQGGYLVVSGFLEAGPGENDGDRLTGDGLDDFTLSPADLALLRDDAARMYPALLEAGWWRTLPELGEFGPTDFLTQLDLVGPGGAGLLVYGSGPHWGTAYLGPDGLEPDSAGTLAAVSGHGGEHLAEEPPSLADAVLADPVLADPMPEDTVPEDTVPEDTVPEDTVPSDTVPGTAIATRRSAMLTPAPRPTGPRAISPVRVPAGEWGIKPASPGLVAPETPTDVKIVVGGLIVAVVAAAIIIGMLVSSVLIAVIAAVVFILVVLGVIWMARL
jgi:hypothetical protein